MSLNTLALMHSASSSPSEVRGQSPPTSPGIRIQSEVDCFGLGQ